jgi:peptidoglycan-associated lipoprotein
MNLKNPWSWLIVPLLSLPLTLASCTKDNPKVSEVITPKKTNKHDFSVDAAGKVSFQAEIVYFAYDDSNLTKEGMSRLDALAEYLRKNPSNKLKVEGHCDERGSTEYNLALGEMRASAVKKYLSGIGITDSQLETVSFGEERPAEQGQGEDFWAKNRRAEFAFVQ